MTRVPGHKRAAVALSGGVDSATTAALLQQEGYDVIALTMRIADSDVYGHEKLEKSIQDARIVAEQLNIPHHVIDVSHEFIDEVITPFISAYTMGRTPNPCALCNRSLKFKSLIAAAQHHDADYLATGHYARVMHHPNGDATLHKAADNSRDQSYFLSRLSHEQLKHVLFPLAEYKKDDLRAIAAKCNLHVADKSDSQDICFIENNDYSNFIKTHFPKTLKPGNICDTHGTVLGQHEGIQLYTIGQRKGIGAFGERKYVVAIDAATATVTIGDNEDLMKTDITIDQLNWLAPVPVKGTRMSIKIRSTSPPAPCIIKDISEDSVRVICDTAQRAITPGQIGALYDDEHVICGGFIV